MVKYLKLFSFASSSFSFLSSHHSGYSSGSERTHFLPKYTKLAAYLLIFLHDPLKILSLYVCPRPLLPSEEAQTSQSSAFPLPTHRGPGPN